MLLSMTEELSRQIEAILADLLVRAEAEAVFFCDRGGNIIAQSCASMYAQEDNIAALAAGSFYATREVAKLLGEAEFRCVFHQGDETSVYMQNTAHDMLLLVVFGKDSNPGLIRLYSNESCQGLDQHMHRAASAPGRQGQMPPHAFEIDETKQPFTRASNLRS